MAHREANNNFHHYSFASDGSHLITSYSYFDQQDVNKLYKNIRLIIEGAGTYDVLVEYRLDDTSTWTMLSTFFTEDSLYNTLDISSTYNKIGRRIQFRFTFHSWNVEYSPKITAIIAEALIQQNFKYYMDITFRLADKDMDLLKTWDARQTLSAKYNYLLAAAESPAGVLVRSRSAVTDNKYYKLDPLSLRMMNKVTRENREYMVCRARLFQLS